MRLGSILLSPIVLAGCFTGADALGLPCNEDLDCGVDQACREGFCGGPPASPETSTSVETSSSSTTPATSEETGPTDCDAMPGDANYCMPMDPGSDDALCNGNCTVVLCGDGYVNESAEEQCEPRVPGVSTCECDADDCTDAICGDAQVNDIAGEQCDQGDAEEYDACTPQCRTNTFADAFDGEGEWVVQNEGILDGWTHEGGEWWSGDYDIRDQKTDPGLAVAGITRLLSPPIEVPPAGVGALVLRFRHRYDFDPYCPDVELANADGGRVELWIGGAPIAWPEAESIYTEMLDTQACTEATLDANPLGAVPAFAGTANDLADVTIPLPEGAYGQTVQIVFLAGFDCGLCDVDDVPDGWRVDAVRIGANEPLGCAGG